ncbi:methylenetetrahydrofolate reductase C-terminal domain-containing protein [Phosphitispora sp. TUW77]|uniref:methylenetetrahydrofolate reductase C-terminal domain-containing protein n=1 Tax=Phosphitispora sp. TUW77 TaxID=3152361 RepID=UPI003AB6AEC3
MIIAERKPIEEILGLLSKHQKVLVLGCGGCVTVCLAGGEKDAGILSSQLAMARSKEQRPLELVQKTIERQCDFEYFEGIRHIVKDVDAILSLACGIGIQTCAEAFPDKLVWPGVNTKFLGVNLNVGEWAERCQACGQCVLDKTGGICPVARCSKSIFNGPCGGSQDGKCEVSPDTECAWALIYDRLTRLGEVDSLREILPVKDWSYSRDGGPRKLVREDLELESGK